jgi:hypothetical protein
MARTLSSDTRVGTGAPRTRATRRTHRRTQSRGRRTLCVSPPCRTGTRGPLPAGREGTRRRGGTARRTRARRGVCGRKGDCTSTPACDSAPCRSGTRCVLKAKALNQDITFQLQGLKPGGFKLMGELDSQLVLTPTVRFSAPQKHGAFETVTGHGGCGPGWHCSRQRCSHPRPLPLSRRPHTSPHE